MTHHYNENYQYPPQAYNQPPQSPNPKKGFPTWAKVLIGGVGVLVFFGACGAIVSDEETETISSSPAINAQQPEPVPNAENAQPFVAPEPVQSQSDPGVGVAVRDGKLEFLVSSWDGASSINISVTNIGNRPVFFSGDNVKIVDTQGREFTPESDWSSDLWFAELQPGQSVSGTLTYSMYGATPSHLMLHDSMFSSGARVNLN